MNKVEAYEAYPNLKVLGTGDLIALLEGAQELDDKEFAEAITAILKETRTEL